MKMPSLAIRTSGMAVALACAVNSVAQPQVAVKDAADAKSVLPSRQPSKTNDFPTADIRARLLAHTGGIVQQQTNSLRVVFLNIQQRVGKDDLAQVPDAISTLFRIESTLKNKPGAGQTPMRAAMDELKDAQTGLAIAIGDSPDFPSLLIAPESRWALINVAPLVVDKPTPDILADRVRKGQWRAFAHLAGMANASTTNCLMQTVRSLEELDRLMETPSIETIARLFPGIIGLGIVPARVASYRRACEEGWAPPPTNDIQQAIWDEVMTRKRSQRSGSNGRPAHYE